MVQRTSRNKFLRPDHSPLSNRQYCFAGHEVRRGFLRLSSGTNLDAGERISYALEILGAELMHIADISARDWVFLTLVKTTNQKMPLGLTRDVDKMKRLTVDVDKTVHGHAVHAADESVQSGLCKRQADGEAQLRHVIGLDPETLVVVRPHLGVSVGAETWNSPTECDFSVVGSESSPCLFVRRYSWRKNAPKLEIYGASKGVLRTRKSASLGQSTRDR